MDEASMRVGRPLRIANKLKRWYKEAGFVDVHEEVFKLPCNPWPKDPHLKDLGRVGQRLVTLSIRASAALVLRFPVADGSVSPL